MKVPKEYLLLFILGLFLLAYLLEAVVNPLSVKLATPYAFFTQTYLSSYPFSMATILVRSFAFFLTPLFFLSFFKGAHFFKAGALLVVSVLAQIYSVQEVATGTTLVPLEWSLALTAAGLALLLPTLLHLLGALFGGAKNAVYEEPDFDDDSLEEKE